MRFPLFLLLITLHSCSAAPSPPPVPDGEALMAFKSAADTRNLLLFNRSSLHCLWPGIRCSSSGRVVRLVLEASSLAGTLPATALSDLNELRILSLKSNALSGTIPDLSGLLNLKSLFLSYNLLSGPFPPSLLALRRLRTLDLSHNRLSGSIPASLPTSLDRLSSLDLSNNELNGSIPSFNQSTLKSLNLSNNNLTGAVPVTVVISTFPVSVFSGNPGLCGEAVRRECRSHFQFFRPPGSIAPAPGAAAAAASGGSGSRSSSGGGGDAALLASPPSERRRRAITAIAFLAAGFLLILVVGVMLAVRKRRRMGKGKRLTPANAAGVDRSNEFLSEHNVVDVESGGNELAAAATAMMMSEEKVKRLGKSGCLMFCAGEAPVYTLEQLMRASAEMLGRGSVGSTYKAVLDNRLIVSVKRLDAAKLGMTGKEAFERHMDAVGRLRHPNLVPLRAYFQAKEERLLVYDYQPNGSLYSLIHGSRSTRAKPLHWTSCLKIAEDVAQGLAYIHQASRLVHGNIKSPNVLLGPDFEACLTDNCLSFLVEPLDSEDDSVYRAPETQKSNTKLTPRSDIYAFGVLLLELLTGSQHPVVSWTDLPAWVRSVRDDEGADDERLSMIIDIAAACVRSSAEGRPTTWQLLKMIQEVKDADIGTNDDSACIA